MSESPNLEMRWDLDSIFPGGSDSAEYKRFRDRLRSDLEMCREKFAELPDKLSAGNRAAYAEAILDLQRLSDDIELAYSFGQCLQSQDVNDRQAMQLVQEADVMVSEFKNISTRLESLARKQSDSEWQALVEYPNLKEIQFSLNETRTNARAKMEEEFETFANELAVNGFHAWNRIYDKMAGDLRVEFSENGKTETLSMGQLSSKMDSPNRAIRRQAFEKLEGAWEKLADYAAITLNSIAGFRLTMMKNRNWESPLYEPLTMGRLQKKTLDAMWRAVEKGVPKLVPYIEAKKRLLGIDKFMWYDQTAPVTGPDTRVSYKEAKKFVVDNLSTFSSEMADFSKVALDKRWVEAENRSGKAAGGYCTSFGPKKESRIFMTYLDTYGDLETLAHELGHAYHQWVLKDAPPFAAEYPMNLAETASIFNELLVNDAALASAKDEKQRLMLLDQKLQRAHILFCNIYARYIFDCDFHEERREGVVSRQRLDELMVTAQRKAFGDTLDESGTHKLFWASKLHFYLSWVPFYNFPYTFGFLFAGGVYDRAKKEGKTFATKYRDLLYDTGRMKTEELGKKHLGVDLTTDEFWTAAVDRMVEDVDEYVKKVG